VRAPKIIVQPFCTDLPIQLRFWAGFLWQWPQSLDFWPNSVPVFGTSYVANHVKKLKQIKSKKNCIDLFGPVHVVKVSNLPTWLGLLILFSNSSDLSYC